MVIGGLEKFSLIDYPGHLAAVIFTKSCNFRCHFCYNPMLVWPSTDDINQEDHPTIKEDDLLDFLKKRIGKLDAVVISGGEPTLHSDLPEFIIKIRKMGFKVKLDTNGTNPQLVNNLIKDKIIDYIAMDIKAPLNKYDLVTGTQPDIQKIQESIDLLMKNFVPYEFRTTIVPQLLNKSDIEKIGKIIKGAKRWYLQQFRSDTKLVNKNFEGIASYSEEELQEMLNIGKQYVKLCELRGQ